MKLSDFKGQVGRAAGSFPRPTPPAEPPKVAGSATSRPTTTRRAPSILGVSFDTPAENKKFAEKFHFNFPLICDTDRTIGTAYGANADPAEGRAARRAS